MLAAIVDGRWQPGIGDPSLMGWVTVGAYLATAALCLRSGRSLRTSLPPSEGSRPVWFCYALAAVMVLLGVNKQLDLQSWLTQTGASLARAQGWYEQRRLVQAVFVAVLVAVGTVVLLLLVLWTRGHRRRFALALIGVTLLGCFIAIRASSFHRVDEMLGWRPAGLKLNWILEIGGIGLVAAGAVWGRAGSGASRAPPAPR
ncbi:MAG: hypothetical protein ACYS99_03735 [Planctomycetota bacterium]